MHQVALAFVWHQHQPYYPDNVSGENLMPWVRLHATKDYYGMALHLDEVPEMRCTINLVPSLLVQLLAYLDGAEDEHLRVSRMPADSLSKKDAIYLLDNFFMAQPDCMIRPLPRYWELFLRRSAHAEAAEAVLHRFRARDLRDLQVLSNLAWIHPLVFEIDPEMAAFRAKGKGYTEDEKLWLLGKQLEIIGRIVPLHRRLAERGQVELTTTPFYHPILPLLWDKRLARDAMPDVTLPRAWESYPPDAVHHIQRAVEYHAQLFGRRPVGMWPSEGSVCQPMIPAVAGAGIRWIATDEEILSRSLNGAVSRDARGYVRNPELLYRPWRVAEAHHELSIIFRDHALSDMIGFHYQRSPAQAAADDLIGKVQAIGRATESGLGGRPALVPIILDGENCWEYYPGGGVEFLRALYRRATATPGVRPVPVSEFLQQYPPSETIGRLFAGSWISHNFAIWIGHPEDNRAWDLLHATREHLKRTEAQGLVSKDKVRRAWEEIYIAEGSDWFWWFGDDHSSAQDAVFDYLFRKHLQNVYLILGAEPPVDLNRMITKAQRRPTYTLPKCFLKPRIDGRRSSYFKWTGAGRYVCQNERGTMTLVSRGLMKELYFGFDVQNLLLRIDTEGKARQRLAEVETLRVAFGEPRGYELCIGQPGWENPIVQLYRGDEPIGPDGVQVAIDQIAEILIPFERLGLKVDDPICWFVELLGQEQSLDRAPREGFIELSTPSPDFERIMWQV